mgnify:CR=1 FL=1
MPALTIGYGIALIVLGLAGYFGTGIMDPSKKVSWTALIPAMFGAVALLLGLTAGIPRARMHAMHGAALLSLLAFLLPLGRIISAVSKGTFDVTRPATLALLTMAVLSAGFLGMCIRSFINARRARQAEPENNAG